MYGCGGGDAFDFYSFSSSYLWTWKGKKIITTQHRCIQFIAALDIFQKDDLKNRMNSSFSLYHPGAIHPFLHIILVKTASPARNWINSVPQTAATTFFHAMQFYRIVCRYLYLKYKKTLSNTSESSLTWIFVSLILTWIVISDLTLILTWWTTWTSSSFSSFYHPAGKYYCKKHFFKLRARTCLTWQWQRLLFPPIQVQIKKPFWEPSRFFSILFSSSNVILRV